MSTANILPADPSAIANRRDLRSSLVSLRGMFLVVADLGALLVASFLAPDCSHFLLCLRCPFLKWDG
jgi:hypothetical protein